VNRFLQTRFIIVALFLGIGLEGRPAENGPRYEKLRHDKFPCTIHVVKVPREGLRWEVRTMHADGKALGLQKLTGQMKHLEGAEAKAAINGDYYVRQGTFAGDPRGLQIMRGELISAPANGASFWIDALDQPNVGITSAKFSVQWPDGTSAPLELNATGENSLVLYTPAVGESLKSRGGVNLVLERNGKSPWLPLRPGRVYSARVREVQRGYDLRLQPDTMVLSLGRKGGSAKVKAGDVVKVSTETQPSLRGVAEALSGGPILVQNGKRSSIKATNSDSYIFSSMHERHPRSAIGWNEEFYFFVSVDGRQPGLSEGMTLEEFGAQLVKVGCEHALNLDGGGSATLWFDGEVRNYLCDGYERKIANGLIVVEKKSVK
jgi:hypothetical protein